MWRLSVRTGAVPGLDRSSGVRSWPRKFGVEALATFSASTL
ncbi:hypothetical protein [Chenggangzhangella methanolivorans]|nr:hypothetical protein [Chenggangzhangella methanolivorans]